MIKVKTITSKRQTDFDNQLTKFLNSLEEQCVGIRSIEYAITTDNREIFRSAMVLYEEEESP